MDKARKINRLIRRYLQGKATSEEQKELESWYASWGSDMLRFLDDDPKKIQDSAKRNLEKIRERLRKDRELRPGKNDSRNKFIILKGQGWKIAAAAVLLGFFIVLYAPLHKKPIPVKIAKSRIKDFQPAGNKAILMLANGKQIILDSGYKGILANQGNTKVLQLSNGQLAYQPNNSTQNLIKPLYNEVITPRGGVYQVILPDGSKAYLNTASSIRFPTSFIGNERLVEITGEVYFEITKNKKKPFKVRVGKLMIQVFGTHFDVMAYQDAHTIRTTLLEGSVQVIADGKSELIKPGQAVEYENNELRILREPNIEKIMAWKNQLFWFDQDDIYTVARELSRWYDINIYIKGNITDLFTGSIPRNLPFSKVFEILQKTGSLHYHFEGENTVIITP